MKRTDSEMLEISTVDDQWTVVVFNRNRKVMKRNCLVKKGRLALNMFVCFVFEVLVGDDVLGKGGAVSIGSD